MKRVFSPIVGLLSISAIVAGVSCNRVELQDPIRVPTDAVAVSVSPSILSAQSAASIYVQSRAEAESPSASKSAFVDDDRFGMYITRSMDSLTLGKNLMRGFDYSNILYTRSGGVFATTSGTPAGTIYYPYKDVNVDMWGIYPYDASAASKSSATYAWQIVADQSAANGVGVAGSDFLVARQKDIVPQVDKIALQFQHKMTRVRLKLLVPSEVDGKKIDHLRAIDKIYFEGTRVKATYDFNKDIVSINSADVATSVTPLARGSENVNPAAPEEGVYYYFEVLLAPQTLSANSLFVRVIVNYVSGTTPTQGLFTLDLPEEFTLQMGKQHSYEVSFDNNLRLRLDGTKILDWDQVSDVSGDLEESETVRIGGVDWAKGNLVANGKHGAKIGRPEDGGLYFQFGSLIGYAGGAGGAGVGVCTKVNGAFWNGSSFDFATDVAVKPSVYAPLTTNWPAYLNLPAGGFGYFYFNDFITDTADYKTVSESRWNNPTLGIGDPCQYYLGKPWRVPTSTEVASLAGISSTNFTAWGTAGLTASKTEAGPGGAHGVWFGASAVGNPQLSTDLFVPMSGYRSTSGAFDEMGNSTLKLGSSSTTSVAATMYSMWCNKTSGVNSRDTNGNRHSAFPIRCVK